MSSSEWYCPICGIVEGTCDGMDGSMMQQCPAEEEEEEVINYKLTERRYTRNISGVVNNHYQRFEDHPRVVTVCSGGCLRSPTAAVVLAQEPYNFNTRSVGIDEGWAITVLDEILLRWADEFVVMEEWMVLSIQVMLDKHGLKTPIVNLDLEDIYSYRDPELMALISVKYDEATNRGAEEEEL